MLQLKDKYQSVRSRSEQICTSLETEDYVVQPVVDVSPPKWHLGHTSWFFETFILIPFVKDYKPYNTSYPFVFNSYYESFGKKIIRTDRGNLSRPTVEDIYSYRHHVDTAMTQLLSDTPSAEIQTLTILGLNHEEQHQELLATDIKYILGHNPLFPPYEELVNQPINDNSEMGVIHVEEGMYNIGYKGNKFCFDNELNNHDVFLAAFTISKALVTNQQYIEFIEDNGYQRHELWHAEGLDWVKNNLISAPLYWHQINNNWHYYSSRGIRKIELNEPVTHISYYEAAAYAAWKGMRLPTEFEWEAASPRFQWGQRWEWTNSAYLPYPGYVREAGAIGEYNGKFMVNQMVLRGASIVTPPGHSRSTYRNFFHPHLQWQYTGIRLAQSGE
ncbi:ergothioneine biosynthesis protein EgtB [Arachidicoccus terrestris]|uniref:ergothioneine biosynthesis protein EgtB n=1 Tax=Arachidicoccus terrestris TaxID=2875539 RepID=UPI001CC6611F|nr:ergothioneine biosynthesis protein EgtB [Arachidicoccus terrestris]UAY56009.1 ergothioneine biosynthesis protein EgtB [Arachidicoccus terrestris]